MAMTLEAVKLKTLEILGSTDILDVDYITQDLLDTEEVKVPDQYGRATYYGHWMRYLYSEEHGEFCYFYSTGDKSSTSESCENDYNYLLESSKYDHEAVGECSSHRDTIFKFTPRTKNIIRAKQAGKDNPIKLDLTLSPNEEKKIAFSTLDNEPAVGILDVIHRFPEVSGKGDLRVTYGEALEWGPSPKSPKDSWNKICTIKNHTKSTQDVTVRFFLIPGIPTK